MSFQTKWAYSDPVQWIKKAHIIVTFQNVQHKYTILQGSREENCYIKGSSTQVALAFFTVTWKAKN